MKTIILITVINLACFTVLNAQAVVPKYISEAVKSFDDGRYFEALPKLLSANTKLGNKNKSISEKGKMAFRIAECYRNMEQYDKANEWYGSSIELKYYEVQPSLYFWQAEMQRMMGKFDLAIKSYEEYKKRISPSDLSHNAEAGIKSCNSFKAFDAEESIFVVKSEQKLNELEFDMAPSFIDKKGALIIFGTGREAISNKEKDPITGEKFMDLWSAEFNAKGEVINKKSIDDNLIINTSDNEGTACMDAKRKTLYFTRCPSKAKQNLGCDIWMVTKAGDDWDDAQKLVIKYPDSLKVVSKDSVPSVGHPCITDDGMMLIFAGDLPGMPGGMGGRDLWYVMYDKKNKAWDTIPINMGKEINTTGNELFPSIGPNGKLYFASDGHPGIGGLDIFSAKRTNEDNTKDKPAKWGIPTNMMYPINSPANDYAMADFDGTRGYFTSERRIGTNKEYKPDIWSFSIPPVLFDLRVVVYEAGKKVKKLSDAKVVVKGSDGSLWEGVTNEKGSTIKLDKKQDGKRHINGKVSYTIVASKDKYFENKKGAKCSTFGVNDKGDVDTTKGLDRNQSFLLEIPLLPKYELRTPEIRYPVDQWSFVNDNSINSSDSLKFLDSLLTNYPDITIDLYSHTDARDTETHNQALSENRAKAVYNYLVDKVGIDPRRINPIGKGESSPAKWIDENGQEQVLTEIYINQFKASDKKKFDKLHQINRRTEVKITGENFDPLTAPAANPKWKVYTVPLPN